MAHRLGAEIAPVGHRTVARTRPVPPAPANRKQQRFSRVEHAPPPEPPGLGPGGASTGPAITRIFSRPRSAAAT